MIITSSILGKDFKKLPLVAQLAIRAGEGFVLYKVGRGVYDNFELRQRLKQYQNAQVTYSQLGPGGQVLPQTVNLASVANEIYDAFYNNDWFGATEDEERAIIALKTVPKAFIPNLEQVYANLHGKDLRADFNRLLDPQEYNEISYLFS